MSMKLASKRGFKSTSLPTPSPPLFALAFRNDCVKNHFNTPITRRSDFIAVGISSKYSYAQNDYLTSAEKIMDSDVVNLECSLEENKLICVMLD